MTSVPMTLEDALRLSGYTIDVYEAPKRTIDTAVGAIAVPALILSRLTWHGDTPPTLGAAFYLDKLPPFHPDYAPVQLSLILDRFRSRRLAYETADEFALAVRRWGALHLGPMSTLTRRYLSTAVPLPLDTVDMTSQTETTGTTAAETTTSGSGTDSVTSSDTSNTTSKGRDAQSEFPQGTLAGNGDYASGAVDHSGVGSVTGTGTTTAERELTGSESRTGSESGQGSSTERGRSGRSVMELLAEQRAAYLNVDSELLDAMESLFLGVFDRSTADATHQDHYGSGWWW